MKAEVGDWSVIEGRTNERPDRRGVITEVHTQDGSAPYVVRLLDTEQEALIFPGPDAVVVTAAEQEEADKRARPRFASMQSTVREHPTGQK